MTTMSVTGTIFGQPEPVYTPLTNVYAQPTPSNKNTPFVKSDA